MGGRGVLVTRSSIDSSIVIGWPAMDVGSLIGFLGFWLREL